MARKLLLATIALAALGLSDATAFAQGHMGTPQEQG